MADRLAENGAITYAQESTATAGTIPRLAGAGQIEADIRKLVADGFYTSPVSGLSVRGRLINKALGSVISFSPTSLFTANEQGLWYDPSDFTIMFQDAAGTIPVTTVEQPVGLIIDKRKGGVLNPQLVTNSTFDTDTDWTKGTGWTIGSGVATKTAGTASTLSQSESFVVGKTYRIVYTITRTAGTLTPLFTGGGTVSGSARTASGTYVDFMTAVTGNNLLNFSADASFAGTVDNVYMREITGNDGYQLTSASRPTLSARYNLLTFTEQFDNAVWAKNAINVSSNSVASPTGTLTADTLTCTALTSSFYVSQSSNTAGANLTNTVSCYLKSNTAQYAYVSLSANTTTTYWATAVVDLTSGTITQTTNGAGVSGAVTSISNLGNGWYKVTVTGTFGAVANNFGIVVGISNTATPTMAGYGIYSWTASGTESIYVWGGDASIANDGVGLPNYQRVNTATDYDTTSFPPYLFYDGTDDHLIGQPNLDLSAGDKVTIWAGQRKLRDTGQPAIVSNVLTPTGTNIFILYAPNGVSVSYRFTNTGTLSASAGNSIFASAPRTNILTAIGDISGDITTLRVDGVLHQTVNTDLGTGNYRATSQFSIGKSSSSHYQGRIYSLIVRMASSTTTQIINTENYVNSKTKAY